METAWKVKETCPRCGGDDDEWVFVKDEETGQKRCYTCHSCWCEWSKMV